MVTVAGATSIINPQVKYCDSSDRINSSIKHHKGWKH